MADQLGLDAIPDTHTSQFSLLEIPRSCRYQRLDRATNLLSLQIDVYLGDLLTRRIDCSFCLYGTAFEHLLLFRCGRQIRNLAAEIKGSIRQTMSPLWTS
jgi:hypothetical protein